MNALISSLKQAKVPLLLIDLWPCWYGIKDKAVFAAQLNDQHLRKRYPATQAALAFLKQYTVVRHSRIDNSA